MLAEHPVRRSFAGVGGAIVTAFGPDLVADAYKPVIVAAGVIVIVGAVFWPLLAKWPGTLLSRHVWWRFRLFKPVAAGGLEKPERRAVEAAEHQPAPSQPQTSLPILQARLINATRDREAADQWSASATRACEQLAEFIGQIKAGEWAERSPNSFKMVLHGVEQALKHAMIAQDARDWINGERFVWEDCKPNTIGPSMTPVEGIRFDLSDNARFIACIENLLLRGFDFESKLRQLAEQRRARIAAIENEIETELRRIHAG